MKTAMQEAIELVKKYDNREIPIKVLLYNLELLQEKEKEQIMNAYCDGAKGGANGTKGQHENGWVSIYTREKYYNQTYNQNK